MSRFTYTELQGGHPIWLLKFTWMGKSWYFSTRPVAPLDGGVAVPHNGQLANISLDASFELLSEAPSEQTASIEISLGVDVGALISEGHDLHTANAELSLWVEGLTYDRRQVMLMGRVQNPTYGAAHEPITFAIEQRIWDDRSLILSEAAQVTPETWASHDGEAENRYYPLVMGQPGRYSAAVDSAAISTTPSTPALYVNTSAKTLLIAGHRVAASTIRIYDTSEDPVLIEDFSITHTTDGLGRTVAVVDISGGSTVTGQIGHKYWAAWSHGPAFTLDGTNGLTGAGDILEHFLARTTTGIDLGRCAAATPHLNGLQLAFYVDEQSSVYQWLLDNMLPLLPISMIQSTQGIYPVVWHPNPQPETQVVETLTAGVGMFRASQVTYVGEVVNYMSIAYAIDGPSNEALRTITLGPKTDEAMGVTYIENIGATISASRYNIKAAAPLSTDLLYGDADALWVLNWQMLAHAFPHREIQYDADPLMAWVEPGAVVKLNDSDLGLTSQLAIWVPAWDDLRLIGRFMLYDNPVIF